MLHRRNCNYLFGQSNKFYTSKCGCFEGPLGNVLRTSWGRPESTSLGRSLTSGRRQDVRLGRPRDGQIGPLGEVLGTLEGDVLGTSWVPIFADRVFKKKKKDKS